MQILEGVCLKCVLMSRRLVVLNLPPFNRLKVECLSLMLHVNCKVLWALFGLSKKPSSSLLLPVQMHKMSSM